MSGAAVAPTPGPFHDLAPAAWAQVRENHRRFIAEKDFGRPLIFGLKSGAPAAISVADVSLAGPRERDPAADAAIHASLRQIGLLANGWGRPDSFPALVIPRRLYGHSQRLAEPFGGEPLVDGDHHCQCWPALSDMSQIKHLRPKPLAACRYLARSLDLVRYCYESTEGRYPIRQMVTTGPIDTANYVTGSTLALAGMYEHPRELHALLRMVTDLLIEHILACRRLAGGNLVPDHTPLLSGYTLCSELRSEYSAAHYAEFEAPYLKQIGDAVGPLIIHASGRWEQSLAGTLADRNIIHLVLWARDTDLAVATRTVGDRISLEAWQSDLPAKGFPSVADFYRYFFARLRPETRFTLAWVHPAEYNQVYDECERAGTLPPQVRRYGRL